MKKNKNTTFYAEGPNWQSTVKVDIDVNDDERSQYIEAGTMAIEKQLFIDNEKDFQLGPIVLVKKEKKTAKEALVNSYICLVNAGKYKIAEDLRTNYKKSSGNDLSLDENGFTF